MYSARDKVYWFAIASRLTVIFLQFIFNFICPDHEADAFVSPTNPREPVNTLDLIVNVFFGGLTRWDGQYFLHIAKYGYTYENTVAFYPLFPLIIRYYASFLSKFLFFLNNDSIAILAGVSLNFMCFVKSALALYDLSTLVFKDTKLSYRAAILYCINPASIFFSAIYSESMFAFVTFYSMFASLKSNPFVFLPLSLSFITRSNGITNIGYPVYHWFRNSFKNNLPNPCSMMCNMLTTLPNLAIIVILSLFPLGLLQVYNYNNFCNIQMNHTIPVHVVHHAIENNLVLVGKDGYYPPWCQDKIPVAYSYVQFKYWNVGFLNYYQFKQIPNFILAIPILYIMLRFIIEFFKAYKGKNIIKLLIFESKDKESREYPLEIFPFAVHGLFLTVFSICYVHIQVSTRLLSSCSPLIYWYGAILMNKYEAPIKCETEISYEDEENIYSKWAVFFMTKKKYSLGAKLILLYFFGYIFVGCFMFSNFLPWT